VVNLSERRTNGTVRLDVTVANDGNASVEGVSVSRGHGNETLENESIGTLAPGTRERVRFQVPVEAVARSRATSIEVTSAFDEAGGRDAERFRLLRPDVRVVPAGVRYVREEGGIRATVPVANAGLGPANATVGVHRGNETLANATVTLGRAANGTRQFETASLSLPETAAGAGVTLRVDTDVPDEDPMDNGFGDRVAPVLRPPHPPELSNASLAAPNGTVSDGDVVTVSVAASDPRDAVANVTANASAFGAGTVELAATGNGSYEGTFAVNESRAGSGDLNVTVRAVDEAGNVATARAESLAGAGLEPIDGTLPTDPDGDGRYEDVNGNGGLDLADAVALFQHREDPVVTDHVAAYDFSGNGEIDLADVVVLFQEVTG